MTTINKIEIYDTIKMETKVFERDTYPCDFDLLILDNTPDYDIQNYAENELDMAKEDNCFTCNCSTDDYTDEFLIEVLEERGHIFLKCDSITDTMKAKELKKLMASL